MARHGSVQGRLLRVGRRDYTTVVLPPMTENLNGATSDLLERFLKAGGTLLACGAPPERIDGAVSDRGAELARLPGWRRVEAARLPALLAAQAPPGFSIARAPGDGGILFHHRRRLEDGELLFLVNTSTRSRSSGQVESAALGVEQWDPATGVVRPYSFETDGPGHALPVRSARGGLAAVVPLAVGARPCPRTGRKTDRAKGPKDRHRSRRVGPNVLVVDYIDVRAGGEKREKTYFYQASQFAFKNNGMERNPWDSAVQFKDELISTDVSGWERRRGHLPVHDQGSRPRTAHGRRGTARPVHRLVQRPAR